MSCVSYENTMQIYKKFWNYDGFQHFLLKKVSKNLECSEIMPIFAADLKLRHSFLNGHGRPRTAFLLH